jgi:hypothetical protein
MTSIIEQLIDQVSVACDLSFAEYGCIPAMWHVIDHKGQLTIFAPPTGNKDVDAQIIRVLLQCTSAQAVLFVGEAWEVCTNTDSETARQIRPSMHPDRREIVAFQGEDDQGEVCGRRVIIRDHGKPTLGPLEVFRPTLSEGRLVGMLPGQGRAQ